MKLVSIVGDDISRLVPVIYAYRKQITEHILVCDRTSVSHAQRLARGLKRLAKHTSTLSWRVRVEQIDASDLLGVAPALRGSIGTFLDVTLVITDAYVMLALLLGEAVHAEGGEVISYDPFSNKLHFFDAGHKLSCTKLAPRLHLEQFLILMGYKILSQQTRETLAHRRVHIERLYTDPHRFKRLRLALLRGEEGFNYKPYKDLLDTLDALDITHRGKLRRGQDKALAGDLFEEYVFWLCEGLGMDDIAMGVQIDFDASTLHPQDKYHISNEFDILIMHQNRIYTIECKYAKHLDGLEYVYKYDAIIDYFGDTAKAIILNISNKPKQPYLQMHVSSNFKGSTLRRAKRSDIHIYHESVLKPKEFQQVVREFFGL